MLLGAFRRAFEAEADREKDSVCLDDGSTGETPGVLAGKLTFGGGFDCLMTAGVLMV